MWEKATRLGLPVVEAHLRYRLPARFDDLIEVHTWVGQASSVTLRYDYEIRRDGALLTDARIKLACVGLDDGRVRRMPREVLEACVGAPDLWRFSPAK